ncbi:MAG: glycosyltransferase family 4 protein [Ilumatobacter sp.]|nr:glycosyltransferase family 4 protein [Ilumatobacter sp.]
MRVGLLCPYSLTIFGGVQMQVLALARELRSRGIEARVLGPCDGPPPDSFVTPLGNSLPTAANGSIAPLAPDPPAVLRTIRVLNDEAFDVLHLHEPLAPGPTLTSVVLHRAPTVGTFHAAGSSSSYRLLNPLLRRLIKRIDHGVVVSKDALELVRAHFDVDYEVLFNAVEVKVIRSVEPFPTPRPTVFFCGRHEDRKGLRVLIEAFDGMPADVDLVIASDGPDTAELVRRTADDPRVHWLGRISDREKFARLAGADIFCAPSLGGESFGVVLIEAMAAGTTVVASDLPGYRNVATDGEDAVLTQPGSVGELTAALRRVLDDDALSNRLRRNGAARAEQFAMTALADRYVEIYERLTASVPR